METGTFSPVLPSKHGDFPYSYVLIPAGQAEFVNRLMTLGPANCLLVKMTKRMSLNGFQSITLW